MSILLIRCPHTGRPISTGIELAPDALDALPDVLSYMICPECGLTHAWWTGEAWLEDGIQVSPTKDEAA